jgi:NADH-quinone oxidoreductase subunit L
MNRLADVFFIISILIMYLLFNSLDYIVIFELIPFLNNKQFTILFFNFYLIDLICFFLFIGAIGKSAQIGLHT